MKTQQKNSGFSLIEVNMAVFVMAIGVLSMAVLYPLGIRESTQGQADLKQSMFADNVLNQVVALASQTNITWTSWNKAVSAPRDGMTTSSSDVDLPDLKTADGDSVFGQLSVPVDMSGRYRVRAYLVPGFSDRVMGVLVQSTELKSTGYNQYSNNPVYYAEVRFQGRPDL